METAMRLSLPALVLAGCHALFPYSAPPSDSATGDRARDGEAPDKGADGGPFDRGSIPRDIWVALDKPALDKPYPKSDSAPPAASACVPPGIALQPYGTAAMVQCDYSGSLTSINQCTAASHCNVNGGWRLCTPSEFLARGGAKLPPPGKPAWIAACVRDNGVIHSASTAPQKCSACDGSTMLSAQIYWECDGGYQGGALANAFLGVHTYGTCKRVGTNVGQNNGMWIAKWAGDPSVPGVLCCWP